MRHARRPRLLALHEHPGRSDIGPLGPLPEAQGSTLQLTPATTPWLASAAWYNTPINIQGKAIEASYTAYLDSACQ